MIPSYGSIVARFSTELDYIKRYVDFLESVTRIDDWQVGGLLRLLSKYKLPIPEGAAANRQYGKPYTIEEVSGIVAEMKRIRPQLTQLISSAQTALDASPQPDGFGSIDVRTNVGEWIEHARHDLPDNSDQSMVLLRSQIQEQNQRLIDEYGEDGDFELTLPDDVDTIVEAARFVIAHDQLSGLLEISEQISHLDLVCRAGQADTELNVFRQGFLLALTAFDAAVFDLTREVLTSCFWTLISRFPARRKISVDDLGRYSSFEEFRDGVVEDELRGLYLKDLLQVLWGLQVDLVPKESPWSFGHLVELVLRRNVHVHNRGIVDSRYLASGDDRMQQFNVHGLRVGDSAVIDRPYLDMALRLSSDAVGAIAEWGEQHD